MVTNPWCNAKGIPFDNQSSIRAPFPVNSTEVYLSKCGRSTYTHIKLTAD